MLCKWLGTYFGWDLILTSSMRKDIDCYNDFQASATLRNCWSREGKVTTHNKYLIFEFLCMRLVEIKFQKEVHA